MKGAKNLNINWQNLSVIGGIGFSEILLQIINKIVFLPYRASKP